jgi:hypothetical protein
MAGILEELSPMTVGSERIALTPADPSSQPRAFSSYEIAVDLSLCEPEQVVLPLEMIVTSPTRTKRTTFRRVVPSELSVLPDEGGRWIVTLREVAHNQWWGRHVFDVAGDDIRARRTS